MRTMTAAEKMVVLSNIFRIHEDLAGVVERISTVNPNAGGTESDLAEILPMLMNARDQYKTALNYLNRRNVKRK